jgi:hypothetical protein
MAYRRRRTTRRKAPARRKRTRRSGYSRRDNAVPSPALTGVTSRVYKFMAPDDRKVALAQNRAQRVAQLKREHMIQTMALNVKGIEAAEKKLKALESPTYENAMATLGDLVIY